MVRPKKEHLISHCLRKHQTNSQTSFDFYWMKTVVRVNVTDKYLILVSQVHHCE